MPSWTFEQAEELFDKSLLDLLFEAQQVHRQWHRANEIQLSTLLSIKTGGCPEDCGYCSQSAFAKSGLKAEKLLDTACVLKAAREAKGAGSSRFCMGAAWREPKDRDMPAICAMVEGVKALGLETCMTLGMLTDSQARQLADAGLDFYNHNLDTSEDYCAEIITTRTYHERLDTLETVRASGIKVCCGGIIGMGEGRVDRIELLITLANLPSPPQSVPINALVPIRGTPLGDRLLDSPQAKLDDLEFVRTIAVARILMPRSVIRLSAGRESLSESSQALCFLAGANSIFTGDKLLTTSNRGSPADAGLFEKLGLRSPLPRSKPPLPKDPSSNMMRDSCASLFADFDAHLRDLESKERLRRLSPRRGHDFASNDYLALADSPSLKVAVAEALSRGVPIGSGGSRLLRGNHPEHELLENEAARFFGSQSALFFSTGYAANSALLSTLPQRGDLIVHDALIHASSHEGIRLSRAEARSAIHNDLQSFTNQVQSWRRSGGRGRPWLAVESLYSMEGDKAPLAELASLAEQHGGFLIVDEAHATGVFGKDGRGLAEAFDGNDHVIVVRTCGKALGCEGALICGPRIITDFLVNRGRGFIFSTAPSPLMAATVRAALRLLVEEPQRRDQLHALMAFAAAKLGPLGVQVSGSQILPLIVGDALETMKFARALEQAGFDVRGIRPPTVPEGTSRLRISITLNVDMTAIQALADAIGTTLA